MAAAGSTYSHTQTFIKTDRIVCRPGNRCLAVDRRQARGAAGGRRGGGRRRHGQAAGGQAPALAQLRGLVVHVHERGLVRGTAHGQTRNGLAHAARLTAAR